MVLGLDDLFTSFHRVPSSQPQFTVVSLFDYDVEEEDRRKGSTTPGIRLHEVFCMNFGLKSAPLQFNRVAEFICTVAACWHNLPIDH